MGERANELVGAECAALTGAAPDGSGVARGACIESVAQAAYLRFGVRTVAEAPTLDALCAELRSRSFAADAFQIEYLRLFPKPRLRRLEAVVPVADAIEGSPNLSFPSIRLLLAATAERFLLGRIEAEPDGAYRAHAGKPFRTSSSLPARLARAMVNLAAGAQTLLDPCCGAGSILLEAASLGMRAVGFDWNRKMVGMSAANARHFGYAAEAGEADARALSFRADAVVTDLPYGKNLEADAENLRGIVRNAARLAPLAAIAAAGDLVPWMRAAGFREVRRYRVPKSAGFSRYIHVGRSDQFGK